MRAFETGCWRWCCELAVRVVPVLGAGRRCWCCELAVHLVTGRPGAGVLEQGGGGGAGCWLCAWWRHGAGAGCRVPVLVLCAGCARGGDRAPALVLLVLAVALVLCVSGAPVLGAGACF